MSTLFAGLSGRLRLPETIAPDMPLIVAVHGGTYTSAYFDVRGHSLLDQAAALGIPILAIDRPGYGESPMLEDGRMASQAHFLTGALGEAWSRYGTGTSGMMIIAHSIGAAISLMLAGAPGDLPLLGIAVSGVGLRTPAGHQPMWEALPDLPHVELPSAMKDEVMFGPAGSYNASMPAASHVSDAPALRAELVDIVSTWHHDVHDILGRIRVPVHYRQAEVDHLWIVDQDEVDGFAAALTNAPRVDAAMVHGTGHCMDFHRIGRALQLQQLGFALQCAADA
jgi:pimeloyl-ACP methyl ester carboxylesterase